MVVEKSLSKDELSSRRYLPPADLLKILLLVQIATLVNISSIPPCQVGEGKSQCWTIGYTPSNDLTVQAIMSTFMNLTGMSPSTILSFKSEAMADAFLYSNPNTTQGIYQFVIDYGCNSIPGATEIEIDQCFAANHTLSEVVGIKFLVQYNQTKTYYRGNKLDTESMYYLPMVNAIERAIIQTMANVSYSYSISKYPHPQLPAINIIATVGPSVIFAAVMFNLVIQVGWIVLEKELKLRETMRVMGLIDGVYWLSWIILNCIMNIFAAFLLIVAGCIFQLPIFLKNDFGTYACLFILFGLSMVPIGILLAAIIDQSSTATTSGFAVFLVGSLIQFFAPILYQSDVGLIAPTLFSLLPFVVFSKGVADLADATANQYQNGLRWSQIGNNSFWPLTKTYYFLAFDFFFYLIIALYVDNVNYGGRPLWFFFTSTYWRGHPTKSEVKRTSARRQKKENEKESENLSWMDSDIREEEDAIKAGKFSQEQGVLLSALTKTYSKPRFLCCGKLKFKAVKEIYLRMDENQLFCLLGHNGAGKSTTIGMLTGLFLPTDGDAFIFGNSITTSMDQIRESMGVCPQHDVLWDLLTAREHLELYAGLKKLYGKEMEEEIANRLDDVRLASAADVPCGNYSGGMKRRLSVSVALIGDPKIVFLDEPTTGMDPVSRRQVWNLIERAKKDRIILLTTHSMEEADVLGDRIAIMKGGRLASLGTRLHLKEKYGNGYFVSITGAPKKAERLQDHVLSFFNAEDSKQASNSIEVEMNPDQKTPGSPQMISTKTDVKLSMEKKAPSTTNEMTPSSKNSVENASNEVEMHPISQKDSDFDNVERTSHDEGLSVFRIPLKFRDCLPQFFKSLESSKKALGINSVQLQMTTLEDVFLRVAEKDEFVERSPTTAEIQKRRRQQFSKYFWISWVSFLIVEKLVMGDPAIVKFAGSHPELPLPCSKNIVMRFVVFA